MVARLVGDALWRNRWAYSIYGPILLPFWLLFDGRFNGLPISMGAFSMIAAAVLGPMFAASAMGLRELRHLPVTARAIWRATWFIATIVPSGMLLTTKTIAFLLITANGGRTAMTAEGVVLSVVFDFIWASVVLLMFLLLGYAGQFAARRVAFFSSLAGAASIAGVLAAFAVPMLISDALPARVEEFTPAMIVVFVAGMAIAIGAMVWTPTRGVLAGERPHVQSRPGGVLSGAATRPRLADRLTGISRVAVPHMLTTVALAVGIGAALVAYGAISGAGPFWFVPLRPELFDPGDTGERGLTYFVTLPCMAAVMLGAWTPWARLLKVMPLAARQINALLVITPFATWTILWVLGLTAYQFAYGTAAVLRIEFAAGMAAITALVHAAMLRFQGGAGTLWVMMALGGLLSPLVKVGLRDGLNYQIAFAVITALALCAAVVINHRTLTRSTSSSRAYRPPQPPFGGPAKPGFW